MYNTGVKMFEIHETYQAQKQGQPSSSVCHKNVTNFGHFLEPGNIHPKCEVVLS